MLGYEKFENGRQGSGKCYLVQGMQKTCKCNKTTFNVKVKHWDNEGWFKLVRYHILGEFCCDSGQKRQIEKQYMCSYGMYG